MNGVVERGELYWIRLGDSVGSEEAVGRPGVVISSKKGNETSNTILIAFTTTQVKYGIINPSTYASGKKTWVLCNQIQTVDKMRLGRYIGKLTDQEMRTVDDALETVLDLGYVDDTALAEKDKEIEKLKAQIVELTGEVAREQAKVIELAAKHEHELLSYKVENAMWQKCYDKALGQLVDMKVSGDLIRRVEQKPVEAPKVPVPVEPNPPAEVVVKDERVDINHCTQTQLKKIGFSDALARAVVVKRPFDSVKDLRNVPGMNAKKYQIFEPKVCCTPVEIIEVDPVVEPVVEPEEPVKQETEEKLNINAVSARELHEKTGLALSTAFCITGYRKQNGPYKNPEDILNAKQVYPVTLDKLRDKIVCGPGIEETPGVKPKNREIKVEPYTGEKVNINLATAEEIHKKTGLSLTVCYSITGCRKRDGNYRAVSDLENVPRFTEYHMAKFGPMFEV